MPSPAEVSSLGQKSQTDYRLLLTSLITKKIGHPADEEYAIGAIAEDGEPICSSAEVGNVGPEWFAAAVRRARQEIRRRRETYMGDVPPHDVEGKIAIIVDDGIATGLTMIAAISEIKRHRPGKLVVAIPVIPYPTAEKLKTMVDDLVSLYIDINYKGAVSAYYKSFDQLEDSEVMALLRSSAKK